MGYSSSNRNHHFQNGGNDFQGKKKPLKILQEKREKTWNFPQSKVHELANE